MGQGACAGYQKHNNNKSKCGNSFQKWNFLEEKDTWKIKGNHYNINHLKKVFKSEFEILLQNSMSNNLVTVHFWNKSNVHLKI